MRFEDPEFLLLLILIIPVVLWSGKRSGRILYSDIQKLTRLKSRSAWHPRKVLIVLRALALACFVLALARPQAGKTLSEVESEGVDIFLAMDTSRSMEARDFRYEGEPETRLSVVKRVVADFIKKRPGDRLGLIVFGEEAFTQCPLTLDHGVLLEFLDKVEIGMAGDATALGSAMGTAVNRMKDLKSKSKIIVLLTDGVSNAGSVDPQTGADLARTFQIKTYTVGVGTDGPAPILVNTPFGKTYVHQHLPLDEATLQAIAKTTEGRYFRATDTDELAEIYEEIDRLEKTEIKVKEYTEYEELLAWMLIPGLLILLSEVLLGQTRLRKIP